MSIRSCLRKTKKITKINTPITLLVTGQSGIAIETSLKKFFIYIDNLYEQAGIPAKYEIFHYSIEDEIKLVFQEEIKKEGTIVEDIWEEIINSPYNKIEEWWDLAFLRLQSKILVKTSIRSYIHYFLTLRLLPQKN